MLLSSKNIDDIGRLNSIDQLRALSLPDWGPYSQKYAGITHILNPNRGSLMEFTFVCGYYGGARIIPNVIYDSGYHHWQADKHLDYYSYRYELEWKDKVYTDLEFFAVDAQARLAKITFHNQRAFSQQFEIMLITTVREPHRWTQLNLQPGEIWIAAENYYSISHWDQYRQDGINRGVQPGDIFVDGLALGGASLGFHYDKTFPSIGDKSRMIKGKCFGLNKNDAVCYDLKLSVDITDAHLFVRYGLCGPKAIRANIKINDLPYLIDLPETSQKFIDFQSIQYTYIKIGDLPAGDYSIHFEVVQVGEFRPQAVQEFILDGFILRSGAVEMNNPPRVQFIHHQTRLNYQLNARETGLLIQPENELEKNYAIWCEYEKTETSEIYKKLNYLYLQPVRELYATDFEASVRRLQIRPGFFQNYDSDTMYLMYRIKPIYCQKKSAQSVYLALVTDADADQALQRAQQIFNERTTIEAKVRQQFEKTRYRVSLPHYALSQERMMTQLLTNVGYPLRLDGEYLKNYTPGKAWGGLYFWDTGFHALGLLEYSPRLALEAISVYFTEKDNPHHALIMHGSPVPVPIHVVWNVYQRTGRLDVLELFYPKAKRMYDFLAGKIMGSTMDKFGNGLLSSYDYFYNAAGWDDYPAQAYIHATFDGDRCLADNIACAAYPSHIIRAAKLLRLAAYELGRDDDIQEFSQDIEYIASALQKWSWDEPAGYFSYVKNDTKKPLYYNEKTNFNMGLDGCAPLIADITSEQQTKTLVKKLKDPRHLWTKIGLSAVDQSAPYFTTGEGYWNGRVWLPYNWFFWKTMLTLGELNFARKIAQTCLDLWNREVNRSYNLWENFIIATGRGAGCSQFAALSAPVLEFYNAYYQPGRFTTGFDVIIHQHEYDAQQNYLKITLSSPFRAGKTGVVAVMQGVGRYQTAINGKITFLKSSTSGAIQFNLNVGIEKTTIEIYPDKK